MSAGTQHGDGFSLQSRPRPAEVMVSGDVVSLIRERESVEQLFAAERLLP
jgi:hypothetical protein